jgi:hypothetical protein
MLGVSHRSIFTERLELRRTRIEDAAAMFEALRHPEMYSFIPRTAPESEADVADRFARVMQETAPGRAEQWLNWTVWLQNGERRSQRFDRLSIRPSPVAARLCARSGGGDDRTPA